MNKKRTKTIRILLVLLVMLTTGGTQRAWAQDNVDGSTIPNGDKAGDISVKTVVNGVETDAGGVATAAAYELPGGCNWMRIIIHVRPKPGYATGLYYITRSEYTSDYDNFVDISGANAGSVFANYPVVDSYSTCIEGSYSAKERDIIAYSDVGVSNIKIKVEFIYIGLELMHNFGDKATVIFYAGGASEPTAFDVTNPGTPITKADPGDWIVAHIVPDDSHWTDLKLLMVYDAGSAFARTRGIGFEDPYKPKLLQVDTYTPAGGDPTPRHDGAGWYYYQIPATHTPAANYTTNVVDGPVVTKFDLGSDCGPLNDKTLTVTDGTTNGWSAELTYDKVSFDFDGSGHSPKTTKIVVKTAGTTMFELDDQAAIAAQITDGYDPAPLTIGDYHTISSHQTDPYGWFFGQDGTTHYSITVPFPGSGMANDPWLIQGAEKLVLLAKCVNEGLCCFDNEFLELDPSDSYSYDMSTVSGFQPIGMQPGYPFCGSFDGKGVTISNLSYTYNPGMAVVVDDDDPKKGIGLFGQLGTSLGDPVEWKKATVTKVTLSNCNISTSDKEICNVGSIAGNVDCGTVSNCLVTVTGEGTSSVSAAASGSNVGALFGKVGSNGVTLENNYYGKNVSVANSTNLTTPRTGYAKRGHWTGSAWDDITVTDGAMLWVKKATVPPVNANGSKVEFNEVEKGTNRYDFGGDDDFYYAVGQPVTLKVTTGTSTDGDIRTFYDELKALTMNGTDISGAKSFTMPEADATIAATFAPSDWFTIPSNGKQYMSFYHKWTTGGGTSASPVNANYAVTDYAGNETIGALTITNASIVTGKITTGDLNGVCYYDMPTLFYCKNGLPAILKFTPDAKASTNVKAWEKFKGTTVDKDMREFANVYVLNGIGDFYLSDITDTDYTLKAHHCYIAVGNIAGVLPARLHINGGEDTGIDDPRIDNTGDNGLWFTIDGRRMDSRPQKKGIYINGGRKVVIK